MQRLLLAVALLSLAPLASAQVYKWTDAGGTVHYSQTPPEEGTHFKKVTTTGSTKPLAAPATTASGAAPATSESAPPPLAPAAPVADTPENRSKLCDALKGNIAALKGNGPVVMNQGGKSVTLDNDQRKQQVDAAQAQQTQFCSK